MPIAYAKVACCKPEELGPRSGVDIAGATAMTVVPAKPPHLKERLDAFLLVAGDVGEMGQPLTARHRWIPAAELDVECEGGGYPLNDVVAFRVAHVSEHLEADGKPVELVYSIRKGST